MVSAMMGLDSMLFGDAADAGDCSGTLGILLKAIVGLALSGTAGIRAVMPLFALSLAHQVTGYPLTGQMDWIESQPVCILLGGLTLAEILADLIPAVDHAADVAMSFVRPFSGALVAVAPNACGGWVVSLPLAVAGGGFAFSTHTVKAATRLGSTATTGGTCNPIISLLETALVAVFVVLSLLSVVFAIIAIVLSLFGIKKASDVIKRARERRQPLIARFNQVRQAMRWKLFTRNQQEDAETQEGADACAASSGGYPAATESDVAATTAAAGVKPSAPPAPPEEEHQA